MTELNGRMHEIRRCVKSVQIRSFLLSAFSCIWTKYGDLRSNSPYSVRIQENTEQKKNFIFGHFSRSEETANVRSRGKLVHNGYVRFIQIDILRRYSAVNFYESKTDSKQHLCFYHVKWDLAHMTLDPLNFEQ